MSSLSSKQTQRTQGQTVSTPTPAPFLASGYQNLATGASDLLKTPASSFLTPANTNQTQAFARAGAGTGDPTASGVTATNGLLGYQAPTLASTDLSPYMNPYQKDVIDATLGDFNQGNAVALNQLRSSTPTGAFNGSRAGVAEGTLTSDNLRTLASTLAGLNSSNFQQAQGAAGTDIANNLASAGIRLNAANQSANLGLLGAQNTRADTAQQLAAGDEERAIAQQNNPATAQSQLLQLYGQLMNLIPTGAFTGQTGTSSGTTTSSTSPGALDIAGILAKIGSTFAKPGYG